MSAILGIACLVIGVVASLVHGGTLDETQTLGNVLVIAGAIIIGAVIISSAIRQNAEKD
jgi:drug/metabolite transporter (DMT)-like permease